jgi:lipopolysaccharide transport system permease protein
VLQPVLTMAVLSLVLGRFAGLDRETGAVPYPLYLYAGLLPWMLFADAVARSTASAVASANLVTKIYFPRLIIPLAAVGGAIVDFAISSVVLLLLMVAYGVWPSWQLLLLPLAIGGVLVVATGVGTLVSALSVASRDFQGVVGFLIQIWMFATPIIYPITIVPERWRPLFAINPMAGVVEGFRGVFLGTPLDWATFLAGLALGLVVLGIGTSYFRSVERRLADGI